VIRYLRRRRDLDIAAASPDKIPALEDVTRRLAELGHNLALRIEEKMKRRGLKDEVEAKKGVSRKRSYRNREGKLMKSVSNTFQKQ
jgi:hypothetical protein